MKKMSEPLEIFRGPNCSIWSDSTIRFDDGVGWGSTDKEETHQLYLALKSLFEKEITPMNLSVNAYGNVSVCEKNLHTNWSWTFTPEESLRLFNLLAKYHQPKPTISVELDYLKEFVNKVVKTEVFNDGSINYMIPPNIGGANYLEEFGLSKEATKYIESIARDNLIKKIEKLGNE
jgi:hypothetical protein